MLTLRPAGLRDLGFVRALRNDPLSRTWSASGSHIGLLKHVKWWLARRRRCEFVFVILKDSTPIGYTRCRLDCLGIGTLSLALSPNWRGRGYGTRAIELTLRATKGIETIRGWQAVIREENVASIRVFERAGFRLAHEEKVERAFITLQLTPSQ